MVRVLCLRGLCKHFRHCSARRPRTMNGMLRRHQQPALGRVRREGREVTMTTVLRNGAMQSFSGRFPRGGARFRSLAMVALTSVPGACGMPVEKTGQIETTESALGTF